MNEREMNYGVTLNNESARPLLANRYRIVRQLGQGGMGSVWLAEDTQLDGKLFAIKMLPSILVANQRAYNQLKSEALVAMKLVHPNIVQIRAFEENNGNPFLVMDYIEGQTLDEWLANRMSDGAAREDARPPENIVPVSRKTSVPAYGRASIPASRIEELSIGEEEVIRLLKPIAEAIDYAHTEGVVHRDIKPANVMIRKDGRPFIMDFGIAREIQETMTRVTGKMSSGTLMYMSPEQLNGDVPKPAQDVYSFAAMVYECIKGEPPFIRGNIEFQIMNKDPEPLAYGSSSVPANRPVIVDSVMAGLAKKPEDRPKSCVAVLEKKVSRIEPAGERPRAWEGEVWPGRRPLRAAKSLEACERPREPRRKFFVKFAAIGFLALGLIGGVCALLGIEDSNDKFEVIEDGMVQLWEGGPYWAAKNIGADKPEGDGYYFWWGDTVGYKREGDKWVASDGSDFNFSFSENNTPTSGKSISELEREGWIEKKNGTYVLTSRHDAARAHWKGAWRMPTKEEFDDLVSKCDWTWTTRNGKNGYVVRGRGNYASMSIFLPAAGNGSGASLYHSDGDYWSSVPMSNSDSECACLLNFIYSFICDTVYSARSTGRSVRPVQGFIK